MAKAKVSLQRISSQQSDGQKTHVVSDEGGMLVPLSEGEFVEVVEHLDELLVRLEWDGLLIVRDAVDDASDDVGRDHDGDLAVESLDTDEQLVYTLDVGLRWEGDVRAESRSDGDLSRGGESVSVKPAVIRRRHEWVAGRTIPKAWSGNQPRLSPLRL